MRLSNNAKHQLAVKLLSDYLIKIEREHLVFSSDRCFDIYIPSSETRIKVFCNYLNAKQYQTLKFISPETDLTIGLPKNHIWEGNPGYPRIVVMLHMICRMIQLQEIVISTFFPLKKSAKMLF